MTVFAKWGSPITGVAMRSCPAREASRGVISGIANAGAHSDARAADAITPRVARRDHAAGG
jgi:hypothetical protein